MILHGKGRKERSVPLWTKTARILEAWLKEIGGSPDSFAFPNVRGGRLTRDGVQYILDQAAESAATRCLSLHSKRVTPHIVRHYLGFLTMSRPGTRARSSEHMREGVPT